MWAGSELRGERGAPGDSTGNCACAMQIGEVIYIVITLGSEREPECVTLPLNSEYYISLN